MGESSTRRDAAYCRVCQLEIASPSGAHLACAIGEQVASLYEEHGPLWPVKFVAGLFVLSLFVSCALTTCGVGS